MCGLQNVIGRLLQYLMIPDVFTVAGTEPTQLLAVDSCGCSLGDSLGLSVLPFLMTQTMEGLFKFYERRLVSENIHGHHQVINMINGYINKSKLHLQYRKPGQEGISSVLLFSQDFISLAVIERDCAAASSMETQCRSD